MSPKRGPQTSDVGDQSWKTSGVLFCVQRTRTTAHTSRNHCPIYFSSTIANCLDNDWTAVCSQQFALREIRWNTNIPTVREPILSYTLCLKKQTKKTILRVETPFQRCFLIDRNGVPLKLQLGPRRPKSSASTVEADGQLAGWGLDGLTVFVGLQTSGKCHAEMMLLYFISHVLKQVIWYLGLNLCYTFVCCYKKYLMCWWHVFGNFAEEKAE